VFQPYLDHWVEFWFRQPKRDAAEILKVQRTIWVMRNGLL